MCIFIISSCDSNTVIFMCPLPHCPSAFNIRPFHLNLYIYNLYVNTHTYLQSPLSASCILRCRADHHLRMGKLSGVQAPIRGNPEENHLTHFQQQPSHSALGLFRSRWSFVCPPQSVLDGQAVFCGEPYCWEFMAMSLSCLTSLALTIFPPHFQRHYEPWVKGLY